MALLSIVILSSAPVAAEDSKSFIAAIDTTFSAQFLKTKSSIKGDKSHSVAVYKVLDIDKLPEMPQQIMPGDLMELTYPCKRKRAQLAPNSPLPWAEVKNDAMLDVHIPNRYLKSRVNTDIETVWQIDNSENRFTILKPKIKEKRYSPR